MTWEDRLQPAAWVSPSGVRFSFDFEDVSRNKTARGTAFNYPDTEGTHVQRTGNTGSRYPLRLFFSGADYDQQIDAFYIALDEPGISVFESPRYGIKRVVHLGEVSQADRLVTRANQGAIELTFFDTIDLIFPQAGQDAASDILATISAFNDATTATFGDKLELDNQTETVSFRNRYEAVIKQAADALKPLVNGERNVRNAFNAVFDSIINGLDVLVGDPLTLASQTLALIQLPATSAAKINVKLNSYVTIADGLIGDKDSAVREPGVDNNPQNAFVNDELVINSCISAAVIAAVGTAGQGSEASAGTAIESLGGYVTRPRAIAAAEVLIELLDKVTVWRDQNYQSLASTGLVDTGESVVPLQRAVAETAGFLVQQSFVLKQERIITLDRARHIVELESELYGTVDENLDFLIDSNDLSGDEILELPAGRRVVFYQ